MDVNCLCWAIFQQVHETINVLLIDKANLRNIFVSPYPTLFLRCGSVGRNVILFSQVLYRLKVVFSCSNIAKAKKKKLLFPVTRPTLPKLTRL